MKSNEIENLDIAIVGGGYGGAAAAHALSRLGAKVSVYEQASQVREVGAGIGLRPSTMNLFRQEGIFDAIAKVSSASDYFEILTATGDPIMKEPWPAMDEFEVHTNTHLIHRHDFIEALLGVLPEGMVQVGHKLVKVTDEGNRASLEFANGKKVTADLVIGADGIKSTVRKQIFSDQEPIFAGEHAYRVVVPMEQGQGLVVDDNLRMYIGRGTKVYVLPLRHRNALSFDITALNTDSTWNPTPTKDEMLATVEGFDERIVKLTESLEMDEINIRAVYDIDPVDNWHTDSITLLGDSAHAMCHHQGQGANSAIMDGGALAEALQQADSLPEALKLFQDTRKPVTDELQAISRQGWSEDEVNDVFPGQKSAGAISQEDQG